MTLFEVDETLTVGQLTRQLGETLKRAFRGELWVQGQIRNLSRSARGHVYFDLIEPIEAGATPKASIPITLFDSNRQIVNRIITRTGNTVRIDDGVEVRIRGSIDFYAPRGQVQINMTSIDPDFTLGRLGADRDRLLRELRAEGIFDANRDVPLPLVPLRVALITSDGSAAHADFTRQLDASGYAFDVTTLATRVQGEFAPEEIANAIAGAGAAAYDVVALVRGGGARTDLAAFDTEPVARAILESRCPVVCGIGHEVDESVADLIAHASFKTPTACAQFLIERVVAFEFALEDRRLRLVELALAIPSRHRLRVQGRALRVSEAVHSRLDEADERRDRAASALERRVARRIVRSHQRLSDRSARLRIAALRAPNTAANYIRDCASELERRAGTQFESATSQLELIEAKVSAVDPAKALRRGWSITTRTDRSVVRDVSKLAVGERLTTRVAGGSVTSVIEEIHASSTSTTSSDTTEST